MYFADTPDGRIRRFQIGQDFSSFSECDLLAEADAAPGSPDGARVDSQGNYWSARVWGSCVVRFDMSGKVDCRVDLPVRAPTCVCFGGEGLDRLYITSLRTRHSEDELARIPEAGSLFTANIDIPGEPQRLCLV